MNHIPENRPQVPAYNRAVALIEVGDFAGAEGALRWLLREDPEDNCARALLGATLVKLDKCMEAEPHLRLAVLEFPDEAFVHNALGWVYGELNRPDLALTYYQRAAHLSSDPMMNLCNIGNCLLRLDRPAEALAPLEAASRMAPEDIWILMDLGAAYTRLARHNLALDVRLRAHSLDPNNHVSIGALASSYSALGQFDTALEYNERAIGLAPDNVVHRSHRALILNKMGRRKDAMEAYATARETTNGCSAQLTSHLRASWKLSCLLENTATQDFTAERLAAFVAPASEHAAPSI
jgi:tetratricopeptide (TPR) repeat protein